MPSVAPVPTTWPPPVATVLSNSEDEISAVKVTAQRSGTLHGLAAFIQGSGVGNATPQLGRFAVYSHNAGTDRPQTLLAQTGTRLVGRDDPILGIPALAVPATPIVAGTVYWIAVQLDSIAGAGKWQVRGLVGGGRSIKGAPAPFGAGMPAAFPAGGAVSTDRIGFGAIFTPAPLSLAGAIVGQFIVGDGTLVGQQPAVPFNDPALLLNGKAFTANVFTDYHSIPMGKPHLTLAAKQVTVHADSTALTGKPALVLNGKAYTILVPQQMHMAKSSLVLRGKAFVLAESDIVNVGKPVLYLLGKPVNAAVPGLVPTTPVDVNLVPTTPQDLVLVGTVEQGFDLVPTVEEFR